MSNTEMRLPAKQLTLEHVKEFVPGQMFEMIAPSGVTYCLELAIETVAGLDEAIEVSRLDPDYPIFPIRNLSVYSENPAVYSFNGLKELLSAIKRYLPCWTNKW